MRQIPKNDEKKDEKRSNPLSRGDVPGGKLLPVAPGCNNSNGMSISQIAGPPTQMPSKERFRSRGPAAIKSIKTNVKDIAEGN